MQTARDVFRAHAGTERELALHNTWPNDLDAYINEACEVPGRGLLCRNCKSNDAVIELLQTRSADEGMTAFIVCSRCRHRRPFS